MNTFNHHILKTDKHQRRSIRLKDYDYSQVGGYFITICSQNHKMILGLPSVQEVIKCWWDKLPIKFRDIKTDQFVIMPNHIHGIIFIVPPNVGATPRGRPDINGQPHRVAPTLGNIVDWFKSMTTNKYIRGVKTDEWKPFYKRFWQRNYYEHIIHNEKELTRIREYIINNPLKWQFDRENPERISNHQYEKEWRWLEGK